VKEYYLHKRIVPLAHDVIIAGEMGNMQQEKQMK